MSQFICFLVALDLTGLLLGSVLGLDKIKELLSKFRPAQAGLVWDMAVFTLAFLAAGGVD